MKILLINTNREQSPWPVIPLGLCYMASVLEKNGYEVMLLDLCFVRRPARKIVRAISDFKPQAIGVSLRNIDNVNMCHPHFYLAKIREQVIKTCQNATSVPLVIGGSAVGIDPVNVMHFLGVHYAIAGDGEQALLNWLNFIQEGGSRTFKGENGFYMKAGDGEIEVPEAMIMTHFNDEVWPRPYRWIDFKKYEKMGGTVNLQAKRGCAFNCIYCSYNIIEGKRHRLRDPGDIVDEIEDWLRVANPRCFEFVDSVFNAPESHALAICDELKRRKIESRFTTMGLNPGCLSDGLLTSMREAGFSNSMCSPDAVSDSILKNLRKNFTQKHLIETVALFKKHELRTFWFLILGGPGESEETVRETLDFCVNRIDPRDVIHLTIGFRVFAQTELKEMMLRDKLLERDHDFLAPTFYISPLIEPMKILEMVHKASAKSKNIITYFDMELYDSIKSFSHFIFPFNPPEHSWEHVPNVNDKFDKLTLWKRIHNRHRRRFKKILSRFEGHYYMPIQY